MKNKPILNLINEQPNPIMDNGINDFEREEPTYHRRHSVSNSHFYDVIGNESFFDTEPTIIDALKYLARKCCCCSKCGQVNYNYSNYNSNKWDYSIEDEVEIAMRERQNHSNYESKKAFLENNNRNTDQDYDILDSKSLSPTTQPKPRFFQKDRYKYGARMRCYCIPCLTYRPKVWQLNTITIIIQFLCLVIMGSIDAITDKEQHHRSRISLGTLVGIMWCFQFTILIQLILICVKKLWQLTFLEIMQLYITSIIMFTGVYTTAFFYDHDEKKLLGAFQAFNFKDTQFGNCDYWGRLIAFFYFSCSQQTLCGVCEIIPKSPPTQILAAIQMLFGIFFSIIIISIGISRVGEDLELRHNEIEHKDDESIMSENRRTCWSALTHNSKIITFRRTIRRFLLLIVIAIQISKNIVEWMTHKSSFADEYSAVHKTIYILFDMVNVCAVIMTSLKFLHIGHMTELKLSFLCQTYLSCMLIFTGVYVDLQSANDIYNNGAFATSDESFIGMWAIFTYFSFAIMTLCGAGLDVRPKTSYATLAVCVEMLIGLFFHVYIFGTGLLLLANKKFRKNRKQKVRERLESIGGDVNDTDIENNIIGTPASNQVAGSDLIMLTLLQER